MLLKKTGQKLKSLTMIWFEWKKVLSSLEPNVNDFIQGIILTGIFFCKRCDVPLTLQSTLPTPPLVDAHRPQQLATDSNETNKHGGGETVTVLTCKA